MTHETADTIRWTSFFLCCALVLCGLITSIWHYNLEEERLEQETFRAAIERGVNPLVVKCAMDYNIQNELACAVMAITADDKKAQTLLQE